MTTEEQLKQALATIEALKAKKVKPLSLKVSEKGALSIYGLSARFPTTLYVQQWERLLEYVPEIKAFIEANRKNLSVKE